MVLVKGGQLLGEIRTSGFGLLPWLEQKTWAMPVGIFCLESQIKEWDCPKGFTIEKTCRCQFPFDRSLPLLINIFYREL